MNIDELVKKYVLQNAIEHNGKAFSKSVLGRLLADYPKFRANIMEIKQRVEWITDEINRLSPTKQKKLIEKLGFIEKKIKSEKKGIGELPGVTIGKFVVRMAPNPNGALTLGHARPAILNYAFAKKYKGKFILRFDDTDPKHKVPEKKFYTWIKEDLKWLGIKWDKVIIASKRFKLYYRYALKLIEMGKAYVCTCDREKWKELRDNRQPCPCRKLSPKINVKRWKKMFLKNGYKEGEAVLRIKTDLENPNPALRDWPAFRIVENPEHPLKKARVWPLLDFQSAIDDHLTGVTHILRGIDLQISEKRQKYIYQYFGWNYPVTITIGKFSLAGLVLSKSKIKEGIKNNIYKGWDDVKLGTLRSLKRRGIQPEAIRNMILDIGVKTSDISISMKNLAAYNRKLIDQKANRYFFVSHPTKIVIKNNKRKRVAIPIHPDKKKKRILYVGKVIYVNAADFENYRNMEIRLKNLFNIILKKETKITTIKNKSIPKIHWVPSSFVEVRVLKEDKMVKGYAEKNLQKEKVGSIVQFERYGFVRIEKKAKNHIIAIFMHQ